MKKLITTRISCAALSLLLLGTAAALSSCTSNISGDENTPSNAYESSVPASYASSAGLEREKGGRTDDIDQQDPTGRTICVDPGHGFVDGGCGEGYYSDGTLEKDITLAIAEKLTARLKLLGYNVIQTHDGKNIPAADTNGNKIFSATERVAYINGLNIDYLISIHINAIDSNPEISGMHIYYQQSYAKMNTWGATIAKNIADSIGEKVEGEDTPAIKDGTDPNTSFALTRDIAAASSLIEVGFVTNESDAANMVDPDWQQDVANAIADGIDEFFIDQD